jgi:hypothetical protein
MAGLVAASTAGSTALVAICVEDLYRRLAGSSRWRFRRHADSRRARVGAPSAAGPIGGGHLGPTLVIDVRHAGAVQVGNGNLQHNILR